MISFIQVNNYFTAAQAASKMPVAGYGSNKRGYPDVSLAGASYVIYSQGKAVGVSGTSASTPVLAGMITLINAARIAAGQPSLGFVNPALYAAANTAGVYNDITTGSNNCLIQSGQSTVTCCSQGYTAVSGWYPMMLTCFIATDTRDSLLTSQSPSCRTCAGTPPRAWVPSTSRT